MKASLVMCILFGLCGLTNAQTQTEAFLKKIPALPKDTCNITKSNVEDFTQKVSILIEELQNQIDALENMADKKMEGSEEAAKAHAMQQMQQQYGLSEQQMKKMQSGKMSEADKQALANQVLQQQTNMSMGEVQNLSKMSEAGKKAYAEAYGTEMMATGQTAQNQQNAASAKNLNQLITEQQAASAKLQATAQKISNLYSTIENDPELQKSYQNIEKWHNKLMSMTGVDYGQGKQMDSLGMLIQKEQIKICNKYTPKYRAALNQHLKLMKAAIPDSYKLAQITGDLSKAQTGVAPPPESIEAGNLQLIKGYLKPLKEAYKFKLYYPEDN